MGKVRVQAAGKSRTASVGGMEEELPRRHLTWADFDRAGRTVWATLREGTRPDRIFAMSRGGLIMGVRLSHAWGDVPLVCPSNDLMPVVDASNDQEILLVDDILATGTTMARMVDHAMEACGARADAVHLVSWHRWPAASVTATNVRRLRHTFAEWADPANWIVYPWEVRSDGTRDDFGGANSRLP